MSPTTEDRGREGPPEPQAPEPHPIDAFPTVGPRRPSLWLLFVPVVLYGLAPVVANRVEPRILGVPFLLAWIIGATVISPLVIWLAARLDPAYRTGAIEPIPVDDAAPGADPAGGNAAGGSRVDGPEGGSR